MIPTAGEPWYNTTLNIWTLAGVVVACLTLWKTVAGLWRRTIGRRRHLIRQLRKIAPRVRDDYVIELIGEPTWMETITCTRRKITESEETPDEERETDLTKRTWKLGSLGYLVTWSHDDAVAIYGITTTSWWFRPRMLVGGTRIRLGKTTFSALDDAMSYWARLGARRFTYLEQHFFGNPGGYRDWYVGVNDIGYRPVAPLGADPEGTLPEPTRKAYQKVATINTVLIGFITPYEEVDSAELFTNAFGPDQDTVRLTETGMRVFDGPLLRVLDKVRDRRWTRRQKRIDKKLQRSHP
ncbi:ETEC_3214 domain-containing protein [Streptomyces sp. NPDC059071]|uniref:ETEC_3214 domain-containing protein n=1 Tax=unclassified Streptomyces TaxID=2593676 RepID=UPI00364C74DB